MGNVIEFPKKPESYTAKSVIEAAAEADLDVVAIMAYRKNGDEWFASTTSDGGALLWLMERLKKQFL